MNTPKRTLLYIMSPSYSGSTLLTTLLANHPQIATIGELKASKLDDIDNYKCSCGELLLECEFWKNITKRINQQGGSFSLRAFNTHFMPHAPLLKKIITPLVRNRLFEQLRNLAIAAVPGCRETIDKIIDANHQVVEAVCAETKADIFLDGSKDPLRIKYFHESQHWNLRVIYLTRDGRGAANSFKKYSNGSISEAAEEWKMKIDEMDNLVNLLPEEMLLKLKYETLCNSPDTSLDEIYKFTGLPNYIVTKNTQNQRLTHILGNDNMRLGEQKAIRLDEKWKRDLNENDLRLFDQIAGDTNRNLGYI